jgi:hypothetical protein
VIYVPDAPGGLFNELWSGKGRNIVTRPEIHFDINARLCGL